MHDRIWISKGCRTVKTFHNFALLTRNSLCLQISNINRHDTCCLLRWMSIMTNEQPHNTTCKRKQRSKFSGMHSEQRLRYKHLRSKRMAGGN